MDFCSGDFPKKSVLFRPIPKSELDINRESKKKIPIGTTNRGPLTPRDGLFKSRKGPLRTKEGLLGSRDGPLRPRKGPFRPLEGTLRARGPSQT